MGSKKFLEKLIASLSDTEIRNLIWFSKKQDGKPKYMDLFDAIRSKLKGNDDFGSLIPHIEASQLPDQRNYLKKQLYNSLSYKQFSGDELGSSLTLAKALFDKGYWQEGKQALEKARLIAEKHDDLTNLLRILELESQLPGSESEAKEEETLKLIQNLRVYLELRSLRLQLANGLR